jgi:hypothetical protein
MEGDVLTGSSDRESTSADLYGGPSAEDLALAAVLHGQVERLDAQSDGRSASLWDEALLLVAEELDDEGDEEEVPGSSLPDLLGSIWE